MRIVVDTAELKRVQQLLGEMQAKAPNVIARALNRSVSNVKSNIPKTVRDNYHIRAQDVKDTLKVEKARVSKLQAKVISKGETLGLDKFKVNPKTVNSRRKAQLKIAVKKDGIKQVLGAFIANANGIKVFKREGKKRLPIERLKGPSVPQMIRNKEGVDKINKESYRTYHKNLNNDINYMLSKMGAK